MGVDDRLEGYGWIAHGSLRDVATGERVETRVAGDCDPGKQAVFEIEAGGRFDLAELLDLVSRPYSIPRPEGGFRKLDSFTEGQVQALYPFALVLACLDGNAFVNHENPEHDLVRQYVPAVFETLSQNGCVELTEDGARFRSDRG